MQIKLVRLLSFILINLQFHVIKIYATLALIIYIQVYFKQGQQLSIIAKLILVILGKIQELRDLSHENIRK